MLPCFTLLGYGRISVSKPNVADYVCVCVNNNTKQHKRGHRTHTHTRGVCVWVFTSHTPTHPHTRKTHTHTYIHTHTQTNKHNMNNNNISLIAQASQPMRSCSRDASTRTVMDGLHRPPRVRAREISRQVRKSAEGKDSSRRIQIEQ